MENLHSSYFSTKSSISLTNTSFTNHNFRLIFLQSAVWLKFSDTRLLSFSLFNLHPPNYLGRDGSQPTKLTVRTLDGSKSLIQWQADGCQQGVELCGSFSISKTLLAYFSLLTGTGWTDIRIKDDDKSTMLHVCSWYGTTEDEIQTYLVPFCLKLSAHWFCTGNHCLVEVPEVGVMEVVLLQTVFPHVQQGAHRQVPKCKGLALQQLQPGHELLRKPNEKFFLMYIL